VTPFPRAESVGSPLQLLLEGKAVVVPVLLGSNKNEGSTFITQPPRDRRRCEWTTVVLSLSPQSAVINRGSHKNQSTSDRAQ
jgi:hypothetical protein